MKKAGKTVSCFICGRTAEITGVAKNASVTPDMVDMYYFKTSEMSGEKERFVCKSCYKKEFCGR